MADSQQKIDWNALGKAAQTMRRFRVQPGTLGRAIPGRRLQRGKRCAAPGGDRQSVRRLGASDSPVRAAALQQARLGSVGEGPRPDFRFGEACYSTAHEAALELLRAGVKRRLPHRERLERHRGSYPQALTTTLRNRRLQRLSPLDDCETL